MPLIQGCSKKAVQQNISALIKEGKSQNQAIAIALSVARQNKNKCSLRRQKILISR